MKQVGPFVFEGGGSLRDLEHVLWERRFTVIVQLYHWRLVRDGVWTLEIEESATVEASRVFDRLAEHGDESFQT